MAVFNVSFLNPALKPKSTGGGSSGISVAMNQLTILQNQLEKDGYLSQGDYDILLEQAQKLELSPGLSTSEKTRVSVKISDYEKRKSSEEFDRSDDLGIMNNTLKSEGYEDVLMVGNNPDEFINGKISSLQAKMSDLSETIERRESSGQDFSDYMNEYQTTMRELQDRYSAMDSMSNFDGKNPISGQAAFVTTNSKGEIIDIDYNRQGSKSGFVETNGMINGFQIYAKPNKKEDGNNIFLIGDEKFSSPDMMTPDPNNPGSMKPQRLVSESMQTGGAFTKGEQGFLNIPGETIQTQSYIPRNSWAKGTDGTLYNRMEDGGYRKYINANAEDLGIDPSRILSIPSQYEAGISRNVVDTVDGAEAISPDEGMDMANDQGGMPSSPFSEGVPSPFTGPIARPSQSRQEGIPEPVPSEQATKSSTPQFGGQVRDRVTAPTDRAPAAGNVFQNAMRTTKSAIKGIFT